MIFGHNEFIFNHFVRYCIVFFSLEIAPHKIFFITLKKSYFNEDQSSIIFLLYQPPRGAWRSLQWNEYSRIFGSAKMFINKIEVPEQSSFNNVQRAETCLV